LGIPCISTDCSGGGPAELIKSGENGILTEMDNWKMLKDNLQKIMDNVEFARKLGENGAKIKEKLNPDLINGEWERFFQRIMGEH